MNDIKKVLKIKAAEKGIRVTDDDPINLLIDVITLWIKENNNALIADLIKRATQADNAEKRERIKQAKYTSELIGKIPLELSLSQKLVIQEQVRLVMDEVRERAIMPWWKKPTFIICTVNLFLTLGILLGLPSIL